MNIPETAKPKLEHINFVQTAVNEKIDRIQKVAQLNVNNPTLKDVIATLSTNRSNLEASVVKAEALLTVLDGDTSAVTQTSVNVKSTANTNYQLNILGGITNDVDILNSRLISVVERLATALGVNTDTPVTTVAPVTNVSGVAGK